MASPMPEPLQERPHAPSQAPSDDSTHIDIEDAALPTEAKVSSPQPTVDPRIEAIRVSKLRWVLLLLFSLSLYIDVLCRAGMLALTSTVTHDLHIKLEANSWVINSFGVTFAAFLALWGRVADLWSPTIVFCGGFFALGVVNLVISFLPDQYSFYVFRALAGIFGAATIPSAYRLIMTLFPSKDVPLAFLFFGMTGAMANASGLVIGGIFGIIYAGGQMAGWRWFFRGVAAISILASILVFVFTPTVRGMKASTKDKARQFDLIGCFLVFSATLLFVLGLTLGASYGWRTAGFIAPFVLSWPLYGGFFLWESRQPEGHAIVPPAFWALPNMGLIMFVALEIFSYWSAVQLPLLQYWQQVEGDSVILSAVRSLPVGVAALIAAVGFSKFIGKIQPRWTLSFGFSVTASSLLLLIYAAGGDLHHDNYWRWYVPGLFLGSFFNAIIYSTLNVVVMQSVSPSMTGMAGALVNISYQIGATVTLSIQAGLLTIRPGNVDNYGNIQIYFWFTFGWCWLLAILSLALLRQTEKSSLT